MKTRWTQLLSALLCVATMAATAIPASAANHPTSESGTTYSGISYTVKYPKIHGTVNVSIKMLEWDDQLDAEVEVVKNLALPVMESGDPFIMTLTSGLTCARCPNCDRVSDPTPPPEDPLVNMGVYDGPCMLLIDTFSVYDINDELNNKPDTFEPVGGSMYVSLSKTANTLLIDGANESVGLKSLNMMRIDDHDHFKATDGAEYFSFLASFELGYYLRLPKVTIDKMDFSKTYNTKELETLIKGATAAKATRYQSSGKLTSGTISDLQYNDFGLTITNPTDAYDSGTIALVLASNAATVHFVDYSLAPKESKTYSVSVAGHMAIDGGHSLELLDGGWGAFLNADIITFESDEDLASYRAAIPYEQNSTWMVTQGAGDGESAGIVVCDGMLGDSWLKNFTGTKRHVQPDLDPGVSHNICKAGGR